MEIVIRCYGKVLKYVESEQIELTIKEKATVSDAFDCLVEEYTELERIIDEKDSLVFMRDGYHLDRSTRLAENDTLSISTPPMRD